MDAGKAPWTSSAKWNAVILDVILSCCDEPKRLHLRLKLVRFALNPVAGRT